MTDAEKKIDALRGELHSYHCEVREHIARFGACDGAVQGLRTDVYGVPGNKDESPGLMGEVANLKNSRRVMLIGLRAAWSVIVLTACGVAAAIFGE